MAHLMTQFARGFAPVSLTRFVARGRATTLSPQLPTAATVVHHQRPSSFSRCLFLLSLSASISSAAKNSNKTLGRAVTYCSPADDESEQPPPASTTAANGNLFPDEWLEEDHYNGITVHLDSTIDKQNAESSTSRQHRLGTDTFADMLSTSLQHWNNQGRRGIWLHLSHAHADKVPIAVQQFGFQYHMVNDKNLILSKWLPTNLPNKLPQGPSHHVGVGCLVFHPADATRMLVVQEKTGPAAAYKLWKMPTGLSDAAEDIPVAAVRELHEETGLQSIFGCIWQFRQAHSSRGGRFVSDLFFVCQLYLESSSGENADNDSEFFKACPEEIAAIQWMAVQDYCAQERWQQSPVYEEMNRVIQEASWRERQQQERQQKDGALRHFSLPLGFGRGSNALYHGLAQNNSPHQSQL